MHQGIAPNKIQSTQNYFQKILQLLTNKTIEQCQENAQLLSQLYTHTIFKQQQSLPTFTLLPNTIQHNQVIIQKNIPIKTFCPHHLLPYFGIATIAYKPQKYLIGLSDLHTLINHYCTQPIIQEALTQKIAEKIKATLQTTHVAIIIKATHTCVIMRTDTNENNTITTSFHGTLQTQYQTLLS